MGFGNSTTKYFEAEREIVKVSQSDFAVDPDENVDDSIEPLIQYLETIEIQYKARLPFTKTNTCSDPKICNELFFDVYDKFKHKYSIAIIYNEIVEFFNFVNKDFYASLCKPLRTLLYNALSSMLNVSLFEKRNAETSVVADTIQPSFRK